MKTSEGELEIPSPEEKEPAKKEGVMNTESIEGMSITTLHLVDSYEDPIEILLAGQERHTPIQATSGKEAARILLDEMRKALLLDWRASFKRRYEPRTGLSPSEKAENEAAELFALFFCERAPEEEEITKLLDELEQVVEGKRELSSVSVTGGYFDLLTEEGADELRMGDDL